MSPPTLSPISEPVSPEPRPPQPEPPALPLTPNSELHPAADRFLLECWLNRHRPDLLARIRRAEAQVGAAWWDARAEAALEAAVAAGQKAMQEALDVGREPAPEPPGPGGFVLAEREFGGFEKVWDLTSSQAARMEAVFAEKGPVAVRTRRGWHSAVEWAERMGGRPATGTRR